MIWFWPQTVRSKLYIFYRIPCVHNRTIVTYIVSSKSYSRNLLVWFKFSNFHFCVRNCGFRAFFLHSQPIRPKSEKVILNHILDPIGFSYSKSDIYIIPTENAFIKTLEKTPFFMKFRIIRINSWLLGQKSKKQLLDTKIQEISEIFKKP